MCTVNVLRKGLIWLLVLTIVAPPPVYGQDQPPPAVKFSQAELDRMLAPIALYPDALLAQVLMAATYPLEVVMADRWVRENKNLKGDALNDSLDKQPWDPSVKALVPFPEVLSMMSQRLDWTQRVGDAFISQQDDVMSTVQKLRDKAYAAGNLESNKEQKVSRSGDVIVIEPADPQIIYVPAYDPWWVYGPWWWPAYPPFVIYPSYPGVVIAPGFIWFGVGFVVGAFWCTAWGHWNWHNHNVFVNVNRTININRTHIVGTGFRTEAWRHEPSHRRGVLYRDQATRERFGQANRQSIEGRRQFRGFPGETGRGMAAPRPGEIQRVPSRQFEGRERPQMTGPQAPSRQIEGGRRPEMAAPRSTMPQSPSRSFESPPAFRSQGHAFEGINQGRGEIQRQSNWGRQSLSSHPQGGVGRPSFPGGAGGGTFHGGGHR